MGKNQPEPSRKDVADMLKRMHDNAASNSSDAGWHAESARQEQLAAKYRDQAKDS